MYFEHFLPNLWLVLSFFLFFFLYINWFDSFLLFLCKLFQSDLPYILYSYNIKFGFGYQGRGGHLKWVRKCIFFYVPWKILGNAGILLLLSDFVFA